MRDRFAPVPYAALAIAGDDGRLAVLDLYTRAHTAEWAPLRVTDRVLAAAWRLDRRQVGSLLTALEVGGLIRVSQPDRWSARTIIVREPGKDFAPGTIVSVTPSSLPDADDAVPAADTSNVLPLKPSPTVDTRALIEPNRTEPNRTDKKNKGAKAPTCDDEQACWDAYQAAWGKDPTLPEWKGIKRALTKYLVPAPVVCRFIVWLAKSQDGKPAYLRDNGYARSETPWRENHFESYVELMQNPPGLGKGGGYERRADDTLPLLTPHPDDDLPY